MTGTDRPRREDAIKRIKTRVLSGEDLLEEYEEVYDENIWAGMTPYASHLIAIDTVNTRTERLHKKKGGGQNALQPT